MSSRMEVEEDNVRTTAKVLECPVCYEILMSPIHQCYNGHLICSNCIEKVSECPVCREAMPGKRIRNRAVEELTKDFLHHCKNRSNGCEAKVKSHELEAHIMFECQYSSLPFCQLLGISDCPVLSTKARISHHMLSDHNVALVDCDSALLNYGRITQEQAKTKVFWTPAIFHCFNQTMYLKSEFDCLTQSFIWTPVVLSRDNTVKDIQATFKVYNTSEDATILWKGPLHRLYEKTEKQTAALVLPVKNNELLFKAGNNGDYLIVHVTFSLKSELEQTNSAAALVDAKIPTVFLETSGTGIPTGGSASAVLQRRGSPVHQGVTCDICSRNDICGIRYKCIECEDYDMCEECEKTSHEHDHHIFARLPVVHPQIRVQDILSRCLGSRRRIPQVARMGGGIIGPLRNRVDLP